MALFAIGDLHLSLGVEKPMDTFSGWHNYVKRLQENWLENIKKEDTVVIAGDFSWGMSLAQAYNDFTFLHQLPGKKILLKGNHDYWWTTAAKMNNFLSANALNSISILHNNAFFINETAICGTRGWLLEDSSVQDEKISSREAGRLIASLNAAEGKEPIVFLHYPPIFNNQFSQNMLDIINKYKVKQCYYGHIHGSGISFAFEGRLDNTQYKLISADALNFLPYKIDF